MNQFTLLVIILVVFTYYGGSNVPKVLKDNKEMLLGVAGGLVLCSFFGLRLEGIHEKGALGAIAHIIPPSWECCADEDEGELLLLEDRVEHLTDDVQ